MLEIGESKHAAKVVYREKCEEKNIKCNPAESDFIHSCTTANSYRQTVGEFCSWLKENETEVWNSKNIDEIDKEVAYDYLHYREDNSCSAYSVSKDMSALNKVLNFDLNKSEGCLKERSYKNVTRSRCDVKQDLKYNPKNYADQIEVAQAFGLRRESICGGNYQIKDTSFFKHEEKIYCSVVEKGGKYREAPCLQKYQEIIAEKYDVQDREHMCKEEFKELYCEKNELLFDRYPKAIDNHAFRAEYARALYTQIAEKKENVKSDYRGYDKEIVLEVSAALGHNRASVVVEHYLR